MKTVITAIAAGIAALLVGVGVGYYVRGDHDAAKKTTAVIAEQHQTAGNVVAAVHASQKLEDDIAASDAVATTNGHAASERVRTQIKYVYMEKKDAKQDPQPEPVACGPAYLDVGTVRLLNATRSGFSLDPASISNDPGAAAPALPIADFVDADNDTVRRYNDLAKRHNALVDSVEEKLKEQAEGK
ncbi:hypothetical protein ACODYM_29350 [Burkholderia gladioli]|uniref:hypothetical protein n=1 Tax=Burkholderia gladioli TaxID=28095 RepID=UPI003B5116D7